MRESSVTYLQADAPDAPGHDIVFGDRFPTDEMAAEMATPAAIVPPRGAARRAVPTPVLTTGRQLEHWHTGAMTRRASLSRCARAGGDSEPAPGRAAPARGGSGRSDPVLTRRGAIELKARFDRAVPEGMVFIPFAFVEAAASHPDQPAARSDRQNPRVQVLRCPGGEGGDRSSGGVRRGAYGRRCAPRAGRPFSRRSEARVGRDREVEAPRGPASGRRRLSAQPRRHDRPLRRDGEQNASPQQAGSAPLWPFDRRRRTGACVAFAVRSCAGTRPEFRPRCRTAARSSVLGAIASARGDRPCSTTASCRATNGFRVPAASEQGEEITRRRDQSNHERGQ